MYHEKINYRKTATTDIKIDKIGQGSLYTQGAYGGRSGNRDWGLKGQLFNFRKRGLKTGETRNLSKDNLTDMEKLISQRLEKHPKRYSAIITRRDKKAIMRRAEELVKTEESNFTRQDKSDLKNIVSTMQEKSRRVIKPPSLNRTSQLNNEEQSTISNINEFLVD